MKVYVYGDPAKPMVTKSIETVESLGHTLAETPTGADVAIAPYLRKRLSPDEINAPRYGTLIFHPSLLPRHRGPDAVKWAMKLGEPYTGVTWFWCDDGLDTGAICEQEIVAITPGDTVANLYADKMVPAGIRCLRRLLTELAWGCVRAAPQNEEAATYESWSEPRKQPLTA